MALLFGFMGRAFGHLGGDADEPGDEAFHELREDGTNELREDGTFELRG